MPTMNATIRTVDMSDYLAWECPALPYTAHAAPYGESIYREFATLEECTTWVESIEGMTGTYGTSWGEVPVWTEVTVHHYVGEPATEEATPVAPLHPSTGMCPVCSDECDTYVSHAHDGAPVAHWEDALMPSPEEVAHEEAISAVRSAVASAASIHAHGLKGHTFVGWAPVSAAVASRRAEWKDVALRVTAFGRVGTLSNSSLQLAPMYARKGL